MRAAAAFLLVPVLGLKSYFEKVRLDLEPVQLIFPPSITGQEITQPSGTRYPLLIFHWYTHGCTIFITHDFTASTIKYRSP